MFLTIYLLWIMTKILMKMLINVLVNGYTMDGRD